MATRNKKILKWLEKNSVGTNYFLPTQDSEEFYVGESWKYEDIRTPSFIYVCYILADISNQEKRGYTSLGTIYLKFIDGVNWHILTIVRFILKIIHCSEYLLSTHSTTMNHVCKTSQDNNTLRLCSRPLTVQQRHFFCDTFLFWRYFVKFCVCVSDKKKCVIILSLLWLWRVFHILTIGWFSNTLAWIGVSGHYDTCLVTLPTRPGLSSSDFHNYVSRHPLKSSFDWEIFGRHLVVIFSDKRRLLFILLPTGLLL